MTEPVRRQTARDAADARSAARPDGSAPDPAARQPTPRPPTRTDHIARQPTPRPPARPDHVARQPTPRPPARPDHVARQPTPRPPARPEPLAPQPTPRPPERRADETGRRRREGSSVDVTPVGERIGGFVVRGEIGRGGAGRIIEAIDPRLRRRVALKQLLPERRGDELARRRFVEEAQIGGRLEHPGILPVYHFGEGADGSEFFCMKLATGRDLGRILEAWHKDSPDAAGYTLARFVAIFERVVEAIGYAHDRGVLHRDLKPSNVMIGDHGEVWLLDWGLAKSADRVEPVGARPIGASDETRSPRLTADGLAVGTPSYMAPEQARGEPADPVSDVFGLGGILYHVLTGKPPFAGKAVRSVLTASAEGRVTPLRASPTGRRAPRALAAICMKCLALEPGDRYQSAAELLDDLRAYQAGEAVSALGEGPLPRLARWVRRHRVVVGWAGAATAALLVVAAIASAAVARQARVAQREAERASVAESDRERIQRDAAERAQRRVAAFAPYAAATDLIGRRQRLDQAVDLLSQAVALDATFVEARFALGEARRLRGDLAAAATDYLKADEQSRAVAGTPHVPALLAAAFALDRVGDYEGADAAFAKLEDADPRHPLALVGRAYRAMRRCAYADAVACARDAAAQAPHLWETRLAYGELRLAAIAAGVAPPDRTAVDEGLAELRVARDLAPLEAEPCVVLATSLITREDDPARGEALALIGRAIDLEPRNPLHLLERAYLRERLGDRAGADADVASAERAGAAAPLVLYHRAMIAYHRDEIERACDLFAQHAQKYRCWPAHVFNWLRLALPLGRLDDPATRARFERWCDENPGYAKTHWLRGMDLLRHGKNDLAQAQAEAGLAQAPHDPALTLLLARCRYEARDLAAAEKLSASVLALDPRHRDARKLHCFALASAGRRAEAREEWKLAKGTVPADEWTAVDAALEGR